VNHSDEADDRSAEMNTAGELSLGKKEPHLYYRTDGEARWPGSLLANSLHRPNSAPRVGDRPDL
jgi:hypothetical protein